MARYKSRVGGFTLVELLVVIVIIGVLSAFAIPRYTLAVAKARFTEATRMVAAYESAFYLFHAENGVPPETPEELAFGVMDSRWFLYEPYARSIYAHATVRMMDFAEGGELSSVYDETADCFVRGSDSPDALMRLAPKFLFNGCTASVGGE